MHFKNCVFKTLVWIIFAILEANARQYIRQSVINADGFFFFINIAIPVSVPNIAGVPSIEKSAIFLKIIGYCVHYYFWCYREINNSSLIILFLLKKRLLYKNEKNQFSYDKQNHLIRYP